MSELATYREAESRVGIDPIGDLLARRSAVVDDIAPLWALFGPGGLADSVRNAERCTIIGMMRAMAVANGEKITEAALEAGSRAHPDYLELMAKQTTDRVRFFKLQEELFEIDARINRGQAIARFAASEART